MKTCSGSGSLLENTCISRACAGNLKGENRQKKSLLAYWQQAFEVSGIIDDPIGSSVQDTFDAGVEYLKKWKQIPMPKLTEENYHRVQFPDSLSGYCSLRGGEVPPLIVGWSIAGVYLHDVACIRSEKQKLRRGPYYQAACNYVHNGVGKGKSGSFSLNQWPGMVDYKWYFSRLVVHLMGGDIDTLTVPVSRFHLLVQINQDN